MLVAIVAEVFATSALKASAGFTRWAPSVAVILGYGAAFWLLSLALKNIPIGIAYAVWAGLGIVLIALAGMVVYGERPDAAAVVGMALIITGVMVMNLMSKMSLR